MTRHGITLSDLRRMRSLRPWKERVAAGLLIAASLGIAGTFAWQDRHAPRVPAASDPTQAAPSPATGQAARVDAVGSVDAPADEAIIDTNLRVSGWALAPEGIERVEVRVDGRPHAARYGIPRPDVASVKSGYPDSSAAGFEFTGDFAKLDPVRHAINVVAIDRSGRETVLARKSLIPPAAMSLWSGLLDQHPALANRPFRFLMMTSGVAAGGAAEADSAYRAYLSHTTGVGIAVPILYLRTTKGVTGDWEFDPNFDLTRKCKDRVVAEDNLHGVIQYAIEKNLPVQFILNGGIWADASCDTPEWDVNDHLEQDIDNCQWTQDNIVFPDDYLKNLAGSTASPELARTLTYNVYATKVRSYKRRNLQAAARIIADFARAYPELFVGVVLDSDTYMNPFFMNKEWFDYNPGMLKQFRQWLSGTGPYAGKPESGVPNLARYRRIHPLTLRDVNKIARRHWASWNEVDPPRKFPGSMRDPPIAGQPLGLGRSVYQEWETFRKHIIGLHYDELSEWVHATGVPSSHIFSAQGFLAPDPNLKPFAVHITSHGQDYDSAGVSVEGAIPRAGHLGAIIYGEAAENQVRMEESHSLFATFSRMDSQWSVVETNSTNLKTPTVHPTYSQSYHSFRDAFNFDAQEVSVMAWNGFNGLYADRPGYLPYTAWRNTPAEAAMRDFMVGHANLPRGAKLWTFGVPGYPDDDGWRLEQGKIYARGGYLDLEFEAATATLLSPPDQVIRTALIDSVVLGLGDPAPLAAIQIFGRVDGNSPWVAIGAPIPQSRFQRVGGGVKVPMIWPQGFRAKNTIVVELKIVLAFNPGGRSARLDRVALYPGYMHPLNP